MLGCKSSLRPLVGYLGETDATFVLTTSFKQGKTHRWGIAWTFISPEKMKTDETTKHFLEGTAEYPYSVDADAEQEKDRVWANEFRALRAQRRKLRLQAILQEQRQEHNPGHKQKHGQANPLSPENPTKRAKRAKRGIPIDTAPWNTTEKLGDGKQHAAESKQTPPGSNSHAQGKHIGAGTRERDNGNTSKGTAKTKKPSKVPKPFTLTIPFSCEEEDSSCKEEPVIRAHRKCLEILKEASNADAISLSQSDTLVQPTAAFATLSGSATANTWARKPQGSGQFSFQLEISLVPKGSGDQLLLLTMHCLEGSRGDCHTLLLYLKGKLQPC